MFEAKVLDTKKDQEAEGTNPPPYNIVQFIRSFFPTSSLNTISFHITRTA